MAENPSTYCPDFFPQKDLSPMVAHSTAIMTALSGREQRRGQLVTGGLRRWSFSSNALNQANRALFRAFFNARRGNLEPFWFFAPTLETVTAFAAGTVTSAAILTIPGKGNWYGNEPSTVPIAAAYSALTVGGVARTISAMTPNIGAGGEDRLTWTVTSTGAVVVTVANFRERIIGRFDMADTLSARLQQDAADVRQAFTITIKELVS